MRAKRSVPWFADICKVLVAIIVGVAPVMADADDPLGDLNGDGLVNLSDLAELLAHYGMMGDSAWEAGEHTIAHWKLNGNGFDVSGNANHLTIKEDRVGWGEDSPNCRCVCMLFDPGDPTGCPDNGALRAPGSGCTYPGDGDWTIEAIVFFPSNLAGYPVVQHYSEHVAGHDPYQLNIENGVAVFQINNDPLATVSADVSGLVGQWFHLAAVYRYQQDIALWVNGERLAIQPTTEIPETLPEYDVYLGGNYCGTGAGLKLDEVRISNTAGSPGWRLYINSNQSDSLAQIDAATGECVEIYAESPLTEYLTGMAVDANENLYLATDGLDAIVRFDRETEEFVLLTDPNDPNCPTMVDPGGAIIGPNGDIYVVAHSPLQVVRYDGISGACHGEFTTGGTLNNPSDLAWGTDDKIYVSSSETDDVQVFDGQTGAFIESIGDSAKLDHPNGVTFGPDGKLYVCSGFSNEIWRFDPATGTWDATAFVPSGTLGFPAFLEFGPDGNLYVGNQDTDSIYRLDGVTGAFIDEFVVGCNMDNPTGLAFVRD